MRQLLAFLALLVALAFPCSVRAAVQREGSVGENLSSTTRASASFSYTVPASLSDSILVVIIGYNGTNSSDFGPTAVTWDGNSLTEQVDTIQLSGRYGEAVWTLASPIAGTKTLVVTYGTNSPQADSIHVLTYSGVSAVGATAGNAATSPSPSVTITTTEDNSMVVGGNHGRGGDLDPFTPGNSETELADGETGTSSSLDIAFWVAEILKATAGNQTFGGSMVGSDRWMISCIELKEAGGAPARRLMVISANHPSEHPVAVQPERLHRERAGGRK